MCVDFECFDSSNQFNEIIVDSLITSVLDLINSVEHGHTDLTRGSVGHQSWYYLPRTFEW